MSIFDKEVPLAAEKNGNDFLQTAEAVTFVLADYNRARSKDITLKHTHSR